MFLNQEVGMLGSIPREIADASANFQFTIQKNEIKYFVLEQMNKKKPRLFCQDGLKHLLKPLLSQNIGKTKSLIWIASKNGKMTENSGDPQSFVRPRMKHLFSFLGLVVIFNKIFNLYQFWNEKYCFGISWDLKCAKKKKFAVFPNWSVLVQIC